MLANWLLQDVPLWVLRLLLFSAMALAYELGAAIHRWRGPRETGSKTEEGYVLSGVLGLLALLMAFSFGMALSRYDARRELVVTEANALSTAYMRTSFLTDPDHLRALMRGYAEARLEFGLSAGEKQHTAELKASALQPVIWAEAVLQLTPGRQTALPNFVLLPLNAAFDAANARKAALDARLPSRVLETLGVFLIGAATVLGFVMVSELRRLRIPAFVMFGLFALALGVILDLDRPRSGAILVPQGAMAETVRLMNSGPP